MNEKLSLVPGEGFEPSRPFGQRILSPQRLPFRHPGAIKAKSDARLVDTRRAAQPDDFARLRQNGKDGLVLYFRTISLDQISGRDIVHLTVGAISALL